MSAATPKVVLHHLNFSRSERMFWLLEELGLPYDVKMHWRTAEGRAPDSLRELSPMAKAPAIEVDGKLLMESGFMVHYLMENFQHAGLESKASDDSVYWSHFSEGSLMLNLQAAFTGMMIRKGMGKVMMLNFLPFFLRGADTYDSYVQKIARANVTPMLHAIEDFLSKHDNFSGSDQLGEGDFMMCFPLKSLIEGTRKGEYDVGPKTCAWLERVQARPAYKRGMERLKTVEKENPRANGDKALL